LQFLLAALGVLIAMACSPEWLRVGVSDAVKGRDGAVTQLVRDLAESASTATESGRKGEGSPLSERLASMVEHGLSSSRS